MKYFLRAILSLIALAISKAIAGKIQRSYAPWQKVGSIQIPAKSQDRLAISKSKTGGGFEAQPGVIPPLGFIHMLSTFLI